MKILNSYYLLPEDFAQKVGVTKDAINYHLRKGHLDHYGYKTKSKVLFKLIPISEIDRFKMAQKSSRSRTGTRKRKPAKERYVPKNR